MNTRELLNEMCGLDQRRRAKSIVSLSNVIYKFRSETAEEIGSIKLNKPAVEIERRGEFVQIEISFISSMDADLKLLWNEIELYGKNVDELTEDIEKEIVSPICNLTIVPLSLEGQYYASAINPVFWSLSAKKMGQNANTIRLLYKAENLNFYQNDAIDIKQLEVEAREEIIYENRQNALAQKEAQQVNDFGQ